MRFLPNPILVTLVLAGCKPGHDSEPGPPDGSSPTVTITAPASATSLRGDVAIEVDASDDIGVTSVQFFVDDGLLIEDDSTPFSTTWSTDEFAEGAHTLKAIATDTSAQTGETEITVTIDRTAPVVAVSAPTQGGVVSGSVDVSADASDDVALDSVVLSVDGDDLATLDAAPYSDTWDSTAAACGAHTIEATATDKAGNTTTDAITVNVDNAPSVSLTSPGDGDGVSGQVTVEASGRDDCGALDVEFELDGSLIASDGTSPYTWEWDTCSAAQGSHTILARARDQGGNTVSETITVDVDQPVEVELLGPSGNLAATEMLEADVSDDDDIAAVIWDLDGAVIGSTSTSSGRADCSLDCSCDRYEYVWDASDVAEGSYILSVTVTDVVGDTATDSWSVTVSYDRDGDGADGAEWGGDDCDDRSADVNPSAAESCTTGFDDDCDGVTNEQDAVDCITFYRDADADGYGDGTDGACWCSATTDYAMVSGTDCDGGDPTVNPSGSETCDGVDEDCNGTVDDGLPTYTYYADVDADGFGDDATAVTACAVPSGVVTTGGDCDDAELNVSPGEAEVCDNGVDDNCDGAGCIESARLSSAYEYTGAPYEYSGFAVSGAGDVNLDGYADMLVGAIANDDAASDAGAAYLVLGSASPASASLSTAYQYGGESESNFAGYSVAGVGDFDSDGYPDMVVGAYGNDDGGTYAGAAYLILGSAVPASASLSAAFEYRGVTANDQAGGSVAGAGDFNGDGYADLLVGAYSNDDGATNAGAAYLVLGRASPASASLSSSYQYTGEASSDYAGTSVAGGGDVDGDGYSDLIVGAYQNDDGATNAGAAYLVLGSTWPASAGLSSGYEYTGEASSDYAGWSVAGAGDVNCDGYADLLVGAKGNDDGASGAGAAYLVLGSASPASGSLSTAYEYSGEALSDSAGAAVAGAGDVDGDGYADLLVGAYSADDGISSVGAAYLLLGSASPASASLSAAYKYLGEANGDRAGAALAGAGDVDGDGYDDLLVGAYQNNDGGGYAGAAYLIMPGTGL